MRLINESEVPFIAIHNTKWDMILSEIPIGKAAVFTKEDHELSTICSSLRRRHNRGRYLDYQAVRRKDIVYVIHKSKKEAHKE